MTRDDNMKSENEGEADDGSGGSPPTSSAVADVEPHASTAEMSGDCGEDGETASGDKPRRRRSKIRFVAKLLLFTVPIAGAGAAGWWARGEFADNVEALDGTDAEDTAEGLPEAEEEAQAAEGRESAGDPIEETSANTTVSDDSAPELARPIMPGVVGMAEAKARNVLEDAGVTASRISIESVGAAGDTGLVVDQEPSPGELIVSFVTLHVTEQITTPQLVGVTEQEAVEALASLGAVEARVEARYVHGTDAGTVVESHPSAGEPLTREVTIVVTEAPSKIQLSDYVSKLPSRDSVGCDSDSISISGTTYANSISCDIYRSFASGQPTMKIRTTEFVLNTRINRLAGTMGLDDFTDDVNHTASFAIYVDDQEPVTWSVAYGDSVPFDIDVSGALRIKLEIQAATSSIDVGESLTAGWADASLIGSKAAIDDLRRKVGL